MTRSCRYVQGLRPRRKVSCLPPTSPDHVFVSSEYAFTLVEIVIVVAIVAVLFVVGAQSFVSARATVNVGQVRAAAMSFGEAVTSYRADNAGSVPTLGTPQWPSGRLETGPLRLDTTSDGGRSMPYLRRRPDVVDSGLVDVVGASTLFANTRVPAGRFGRLVYVASPAGTSFRVEAWSSKGGSFNAKPSCYVGSYTYGLASGVGGCE